LENGAYELHIQEDVLIGTARERVSGLGYTLV
jgi:hypothetical protein